MPLRSTLSATNRQLSLCLMILVWIALFQPFAPANAYALSLEIVHDVFARQAEPPPPPPGHNNGSELLCTPFGACEPCPPDAMNEPFCQPFGNRRLMHCINTTFTSAPPSPSTEHQAQNAVTDTHTSGPPSPNPNHPNQKLTSLQPSGEIPAWESCGRIVSKERADFYEFVSCNVVIAVIALVLLGLRSRRMQVNQARQLAARIGLIRGEGGRILRS